MFHTIRAKSEQIRAEYQNDLAGMVFCADCGRQMEFERLPHGAEESKKVCYYICKARQADDKCIGHQIPEKLLKALIMDQLHGQQNGRKEDIMKAIRWLLKLVLVMITLPLILAVWLAKWFVVFLHHCSAWFFYLLGSVLLVTAMLSFLLQQSQGMEALQMLIGGFVIFMIPQVVGSVIVLLELAAVMLRQAWYI